MSTLFKVQSSNMELIGRVTKVHTDLTLLDDAANWLSYNNNSRLPMVQTVGLEAYTVQNEAKPKVRSRSKTLNRPTASWTVPANSPDKISQTNPKRLR